MNFLIEHSGLLNELYRGDSNDHFRHGFGIQIFMNQAVFVGYWEKNQANGIGKLFFKNKMTIEGHFENNFITQGSVIFPNGAKFQGIFDSSPDQNFESGTFFFTNGTVLSGKWKEGVFLSGKITFPENGQLSPMLVDMENNFKLIENNDFILSNDKFMNHGTSGIQICNSKKTLFEGNMNKDFKVNGQAFRYYHLMKYLDMEYRDSTPNGYGKEINIQKGIEKEFKSENQRLVSRFSIYWANGIMVNFKQDKKISIPVLGKNYFKLGSNFEQKDITEERFQLENVYFIYENEENEERLLSSSFSKAPFDERIVFSLKINFKWIFKNILKSNSGLAEQIIIFLKSHYEDQSYHIMDEMNFLQSSEKKIQTNEKSSNQKMTECLNSVPKKKEKTGENANEFHLEMQFGSQEIKNSHFSKNIEELPNPFQQITIKKPNLNNNSNEHYGYVNFKPENAKKSDPKFNPDFLKKIESLKREKQIETEQKPNPDSDLLQISHFNANPVQISAFIEHCDKLSNKKIVSEKVLSEVSNPVVQIIKAQISEQNSIKNNSFNGSGNSQKDLYFNPSDKKSIFPLLTQNEKSLQIQSDGNSAEKSNSIIAFDNFNEAPKLNNEYEWNSLYKNNLSNKTYDHEKSSQKNQRKENEMKKHSDHEMVSPENCDSKLFSFMKPGNFESIAQTENVLNNKIDPNFKLKSLDRSEILLKSNSEKIIENQTNQDNSEHLFDFIGKKTVVFFEGKTYLGMKNGLCTEIYQDGSMIKGNFKNGTLNGVCVVSTADKNSFHGSFSAGSPKGRFVKITPDGQINSGVIIDGKFVARRKLMWENFEIEVDFEDIHNPTGSGAMLSGDSKYQLFCSFVKGKIPNMSKCKIEDRECGIEYNGSIFPGCKRDCIVITEDHQTFGVNTGTKKIKNLMLSLSGAVKLEEK